MYAVSFPLRHEKNVFPRIDAISDDFVCKRIGAKIEDEEGYFYGSVSKKLDQPSGYGVFVTEEWIHCG